jgi:hypothetical protein
MGHRACLEALEKGLLSMPEYYQFQASTKGGRIVEIHASGSARITNNKNVCIYVCLFT